MQNIEIKTPVDDASALERRLADLGATREWVRRQRDTFFNCRAGYLKLREVEGEPGELIAYEREAGSHARASDYEIVSAPDSAALRSALTRSLGVRGVVEKIRTLYLWKHTRIHLDEVSGLGSFLELETVMRGISREEAESETRTVIAALDLDPSRFLDRPYLEMLEAAGVPARESLPG